jgi:U3 small nucleolar RNA-associated protein 14
LKNFEILQKTDPEAALRQLEQLERTRAEERVSLRHRSTGQWARNKAVRAKYDKEVSMITKHNFFVLQIIPQIQVQI